MQCFGLRKQLQQLQQGMAAEGSVPAPHVLLLARLIVLQPVER
jgi:hypothetical protein